MAPVYRDHDHELDQGDVLADVPFIVRRGGNTTVSPGLGLITSHGCDCERYSRERAKGAPLEFLETYTLQVAPLTDAEPFQAGGKLGDIEKGRVPQYFAIPAEDEHPELLVDLHLEQPVPVLELLKCERRATLSEEMWQRLTVHCFVLQSRLRPETVF